MGEGVGDGVFEHEDGHAKTDLKISRIGLMKVNGKGSKGFLC